MKPAIHDRGRGPEIVGSRITVFDVLAETRAGVPVAQLASEWELSVEEIEFALGYIEEHKEEVERDWAEIRARHARQRKEFEEKYSDRLAASREKLLKAKAEFDRRKAAGASDARPTRGRQHSGSDEEHSSDIRVNGVG